MVLVQARHAKNLNFLQKIRVMFLRCCYFYGDTLYEVVL